ncbi:rRNA maturation RNase YbeY [Adhaeribacter sp. BT258]|uniref:Endoribonuclease YbeY n=1 Tax=Adhaeribacter terrigena TaxID=2793070 RepID=A0ABS1C2G1_9BACT|nr:rRNA maturation RNase YbeY [Adhaeribacter terrigena]MBK0403585.1 rRNA maturation RNase YbeY [Adhaeribacter terrigena]
MLEENISFETEDIHFELTNYQQVSTWIKQVIHNHDYQLGELTFIFCSDDYLHKINLEYLDHDTLTDIITFDNADEEGTIEGDIFVSVERVKENAVELKIPFEDELHRVLIHGVLHLLGHDDTTPELKVAMRWEEDKCLSLRNF